MKKATKFLVAMLLLLLIILSVVWYLFVYDRTFTRDTLLSQARYQDLHGNARLSSWFYDMAYDFSGHDENVAIELSNQYKKTGNYTKAEVTLNHALSSQPTAELYTALCRVYVEQDKLLDAVNLLDHITDPAIQAELNAQRPSAPTPDQAPGFFSQYIDLHLTSSGETILYTTDNTYPTTKGPAYSGSIPLEAGETPIYAISVNKDGLVSPLAVMNYTITGVIEEVTFVDRAIERTVRELIQATSDGPLYSNQLWSIKEFTVPADASTFSDLERMPYLESLTIQGKTLDNLSFLSVLTNLKQLDLSTCRFPTDELAVLTGLTNLTTLNLAECGLSTIAGLTGVNSLRQLNLSNNTLRNLEPLSGMTNLTELSLQHNAVTGLDALSPLVNLSKLNIGFNAVTDLGPLSACVGLTELSANNNQIGGVSPVASLPMLTSLNLEENLLTDVSALAGSTGLTVLNIGSNDITDITPLNTLTKLENFNFSSNQIAQLPEWPDGSALQTIDGSYNQLTSIDVLKNMHELTYVYMDYNVLTNIDALAETYCLVQVNVFGNQIADVSKLREHDIIVNYDPTVKEE